MEFITEKARVPHGISDEDRASMLIFLSKWFSGSYMMSSKADELRMPKAVAQWEKFHQLFPHGLTGEQTLYRVVSLPVAYADQQHFHLPTPALGQLSSWAMRKTGMMYAAGIAREFDDGADTCRLGIEGTVDASQILADTPTIRRVVFDLMADFPWDALDNDRKMLWLGKPVEQWENNHDIGYMWGNMERSKGGYYNQWECVVRTHPIDCTVVQKFRVGHKAINAGWEM
jgi:hypothetical protein